MKQTHALKCWPRYFDDMLANRKPFEIRKDDRQYHAGDLLVLQEYDEEQRRFTGRQCLRIVSRVWYALPGIESGHVVLSIKPATEIADFAMAQSIRRTP